MKNKIRRCKFLVLIIIVSCFSLIYAPISYSLTETGFENAVIRVANTVGKAVVSISAERTEKLMGGIRRYYFDGRGGSPQENPFEDEFFRRFFEDFFGEMPDREYKKVGLGSGVIIDKEGYILTNEHVVAEADKITVTLPDGREFKAQLKGRDKRSDLAVIKIEGGDFTAAALGDSEELKIGQWVVAIGNPFGFALHSPEPTVTSGVISALHRSLGKITSADRDYGDLIQTDAAINPGNSGGPLVNLKGEVIGINVAIFSTSGGYQGIGFAVPVNSAKKIVSKLIAGKDVTYGWLGIMIQDLDDKLMDYFGLSRKKGVLVAKVIKDSPAEKAGIKEGDVIIKVEEKEITAMRGLLKLIGDSEPGKIIKIELIRDKQIISLNAKVGARPGLEDDESAAADKEERTIPEYWRGMQVKEISSDMAKRMRLDSQQGVIITDIKPNSTADESGLIAADVILEINRLKIKDISGYNKAVKTITGDCLLKTTRGFFVLKSDKAG